MTISLSKTYPNRSNMSQVKYNYEFFDYHSCTEGMSSVEEEIHNIFLKQIDEIDNDSSDSFQNDMNVEDAIDFSSAPQPRKKKLKTF